MMCIGKGINLDSCNNVVMLSHCESTCLSMRIFYLVVHSRRSDIGRLLSAALVMQWKSVNAGIIGVVDRSARS